MINIIYAFDNNYVLPFSVSAYSLLKNTSNPENIHVYALCDSINDKIGVNKINKVFNYFGAKLTIIDTAIEKLGSLKISQHCSYVSRAMYIRFYIADLIPDIDKCIYIDCDTLVQGDINELWNINLSPYILGAVYEESMSKHGIKTFDFKNWDGFNSGMLVFDLDKFRKENILDKLLDIHDKYVDKLKYPDQDILNILFHENKYNLPQEWNVYHAWANQEQLNSAKIIHYLMPEKPWDNLSKPEYSTYNNIYTEYINYD